MTLLTVISMFVCTLIWEVKTDVFSVVKKKSLQAGWLKSELERRLPGSSGLSTQDMCTTVFDILCSVHTDDQIQNEVSISMYASLFLRRAAFEINLSFH